MSQASFFDARGFSDRLFAVPSLQIVYASTSGHTEFVVGRIAAAIPGAIVTRVEHATPETLLAGDALLLASGTWNTGGIEGQLSPHMHAFLKGAAKDVDLKGKKVAIVALGDARYRYTANAGNHLEEYVKIHGGTLLGERLVIVNEPYDQEAAVEAWAKNLSALLA
jgi:flavodoxin I